MIKITEEDKKRIEEAVCSVEQKTSGEIIPVIIRTSDIYSAAELRAGIVVSVILPLALYWVFPFHPAIFYIITMLSGFLIGFFSCRIPSIKSLFILKYEMNEEVHQKAIQFFHELDLKATQGRSGILILISLLEHRVEILADSGIHKKIEDHNWTPFLGPLLKKIKAGQTVDGLCSTILEIGKVLETHFPASRTNLNEIPNRVIVNLN